MALLIYEAQDFGIHHGPSLNGRNSINFKWVDLIRAAITVGRANERDVWRHGIYSWYESLYRQFIVFANLKEDITGFVIRSHGYQSLDPSEKSAVSYFLGLSATKLLAEKLLRTPWLMHLDIYTHLNPVLINKSKPDMVGLDNRGRWVIVEAKGRSNNFDKKAMVKAKNQTLQLRKIDGELPNLRVAFQSYFDNNLFCVNLQDPPDHAEDAVDITIGIDRMLTDYYSPISSYFKLADNSVVERIGKREYIMSNLNNVNLRVGIERRLFSSLREGKFENIIENMAYEDIDSQENTDELISIGKDGIVVVAGNQWSDENMKKPPYERF
ncbi:hypothetical protein [Brevibacillus brevis]|uniref:hypothetical protein n=1 Tax=Brevibacillus brevis TaxID=1393 RepID=UPI0037C66F79